MRGECFLVMEDWEASEANLINCRLLGHQVGAERAAMINLSTPPLITARPQNVLVTHAGCGQNSLLLIDSLWSWIYKETDFIKDILKLRYLPLTIGECIND